MESRTAFEPASIAAMWTGSGIQVLSPEVRERGRRSVLRTSNAQLLANALPQKFVDRRHAGLAIEFQKVVPLCHRFKFPLDHCLVTDERPIQIVRKRHIAP